MCLFINRFISLFIFYDEDQPDEIEVGLEAGKTLLDILVRCNILFVIIIMIIIIIIIKNMIIIITIIIMIIITILIIIVIIIIVIILISVFTVGTKTLISKV